MRAGALITTPLFLLVAACGDDGETTDCSPPCGAGFVCNPATRQCEPEKKQCTPACQSPQICDTQSGQCVSPACNPPCGAGADCTNGTCACRSGYHDCDGDLGKSGGNGCECDKPCAQCKPQCVVATKGSCASETLYCETNGVCVSCGQGARNCDGDNVNKCEVTAASCSPSSGMADDKCPAATPAVTQTTTFKSITTKQSIPDHCTMTNPFSQVVAIQLAAKKKLTFMALASGAELALSLRTQCAVDHGCGIGIGTVTYSRTVEAGTYNLVVATNKSTSYDLTVTVEDP